MSKEEEKNIYDEIKTAFGDNEINSIGKLIHSMAEQFFNEYNLEGAVVFNEDVYAQCMQDYFVDLARMKCFHDIEKINYIKIIAYASSWILKRKPFQLIKEKENKKELVFINEIFVYSMLMIAGGLKDDDKAYSFNSQEELLDNFNRIFYHLKYRNTNPQTLELFLVGIQTCNKLS